VPDTATDLPPDVLADVVALGHELVRVNRRKNLVPPGARLEVSAFRLLWVLSDGEPRTLRELSAALDLEQSTVNRQVHAALDAGLVERFDAEGRAGKLVRPTAAGTEAYEHDGLLRARRLSAALDRLGPDRVHRLTADLGAFNDAFDAVLEGD
jgi:DNA-binding MarR family transcriptional regulator